MVIRLFVHEGEGRSQERRAVCVRRDQAVVSDRGLQVADRATKDSLLGMVERLLSRGRQASSLVLWSVL